MKKMKLYYVYNSLHVPVDYCYVIAENEKRALEIATPNFEMGLQKLEHGGRMKLFAEELCNDTSREYCTHIYDGYE